MPSTSTPLDFTKKLCKSYVLYGAMVLLPSTAFLAPSDITPASLQDLYHLIAHHMKITHIAIAHPIPLHRGNDPSTTNTDDTENLLRSPSNFQPLFGDFGPSSCHHPPTALDFERAFWTTTKQNGLFQTWAPRWTMFSRGNVTEKARLLTLPSVHAAVQQGRDDGRGCAAVDLYVGIGYFAFSYLGAGVRTVVGWDLNGWSVEGLRRGARRNRWAVHVEGQTAEVEDDVRLWVFQESNEWALRRLDGMRAALPPVRHVNCGLLPTSRGSWGTALLALDPEMGGWIHVHENFAVAEIETKAEEVRRAFQEMLSTPAGERLVAIEAVNRLKTYAPGVVHCVVDIYIPPASSSAPIPGSS